MKNTKLRVGTAATLGALLAAAALSGCTSSTSTTASSGTSSPSATTSATASGVAASASSASTQGTEPTQGTTATATAAGTSACTDADLKVTESWAGDGDTHTGWIVVFTNTGSASCSIEGYPGAGVTDTPGQVVLNATREQAGYIGGQYPSPTAIQLAPGKAASTVVEWVTAPPNGQTPVGANCPGMDSGKVLITPPNTTQSTSFPAPSNLCTQFEVHPLIPGSTGRTA